MESLGRGKYSPPGRARRAESMQAAPGSHPPALRSSPQSVLAFVENPPGPGGGFAMVSVVCFPATAVVFCYGACGPPFGHGGELLGRSAPSPVHRCRPFHVCSDTVRHARLSYVARSMPYSVRPYVKTARPPCPGPKRTHRSAAVACRSQHRPPSAEVLTMV